MAREIVITSVPRGVKLGRTGFQVAMQTAGLRDDLSAVLEKMAAYRHLPPGSGPNPVSWFHRLARTVAGPVHVVGRIVDAGVDFSNRSNKLAHMVVLDAADLGQVSQSSPAAMLAAVEGRLATSWTAGPEERQAPFSLTGIPASPAAACHTWEQVLGDAGWAGVVADRAVHNQPTMLVAADSSPASCRRLLTMFAEASAVVPPAKRWAITFDTTTLAPDGILWRGTYAGSPESHASQPGLLVIDLSRPQPIPATMASGDLIQIARNGPAKAALPTAISGERRGGPPPAILPPIPGAPQAPAPFSVGPLATRSRHDDDWEEVPLGRSRGGGSRTLIKVGVVLAAIAILGGVAAALVFGLRRGESRSVTARPPDRRTDQKIPQKPVPKPEQKPVETTKPPPRPRSDDRPNPQSIQPPTPTADPPAPEPDVEELAFGTLKQAIQKEREAERSLWPPPAAVFAPIPHLQFDLLVGRNQACEATATRREDSRDWRILVDKTTVATVDRKDTGLQFSRADDCPEEVWSRLAPLLKFMPLAFKRPSRPLDPEDWVVLARAGVAQLSGSESLYDLFCGDGSAQLPDGFEWQHPSDVTWLKRTISIANSPLTITAIPVDRDEFRLEVAAAIDDRQYVLAESITVDRTGDVVRRAGRSWTDRRTRLAKISPKAPQSDAQLLGFKDGKFAGILGGRTTHVVAALLDGVVEDPNATNHGKPLLDACEIKEAKDDSNRLSIEELRTALRDGLAGMSGDFRNWALAAWASSGQKDRDLEGFEPPPRTPEEPDGVYGGRVQKARQDFQDKHASKWVLAAASDVKVLEAFLTANGGRNAAPLKSSSIIEPEAAVIRALVELDGMVVAKVFGDDVEAALRRVPVAALFEGVASLDWEVPGGRPVRVKIATIQPAAALSAAAATAPKADDLTPAEPQP